MQRGNRTSFVVRVVSGKGGRISGLVERVATGAKETFTGAEEIGRVITRMLPGAASRGGTKMMKTVRSLVVMVVLLGLVGLSQYAEAKVLCVDLLGILAVRDHCILRETQLDPASVGLVGPAEIGRAHV